MIDVYNMTSHTRPSRLSVCNIKKAGNGPGDEAIHVCTMYIIHIQIHIDQQVHWKLQTHALCSIKAIIILYMKIN